MCEVDHVVDGKVMKVVIGVKKYCQWSIPCSIINTSL